MMMEWQRVNFGVVSSFADVIMRLLRRDRVKIAKKKYPKKYWLANIKVVNLK